MDHQNNMALVNHVRQTIQQQMDFLKSQVSKQEYDDFVRNLSSQWASNNNNNMNSPYTGGSPYANNKGAMPSPGSMSSPPGPMPSPASNYSNNNNSATPPPPPPNYAAATSRESVEALYDFNGQNAEDLSFQRGDIIQVTEHVNNDWWRGTLRGRTGLFPSAYVQKSTAPRQEKPTPPSTPSRNSIPPPPAATGNYGYPPPPAPSNNVVATGGNAYPPPPPQQQQYNNGGYAPPPQQQQYNNGGYAPPPVQAAPEHQVESSSGGGMAGKASGMFSKVGGQIANAATLGFGATLGSEAAHAIF